MIKQLKSNYECPSGVWVETWNGRDGNNNPVQWGTYSVEIIAISKYINRTTQQPVNSVTKSANFTLCESECQCGDANSDHSIDISDAVFLINYVFSGGVPPADCGYPKAMGDANGDGVVDISDAVFLIGYIFSGGAAPHCQ